MAALHRSHQAQAQPVSSFDGRPITLSRRVSGVLADLRAFMVRNAPHLSLLSVVRREISLFNDTHKSYFPSNRPSARTTVGVTALAVCASVHTDPIARRLQKDAD